jgi:3',5'-cyclic-AMP phosphodiesterase
METGYNGLRFAVQESRFMPDTLLHFVHISDTHLLAPGRVKDFTGIQPELALYAQQVTALPYHTMTAVEALMQQINALPLKIDFVLHTGDVAGEDNSDYEPFVQVFRQINVPVIFAPGNHDREADMTSLYRREPESVYEYDISGIQIVCLDSSRAEVRDAGWLDEQALNRLEVICASEDERPLLVAVHHHPIPIGVVWLDALRLGNGDMLHQILLQARHRLRGVFCGHIHHSVDIVKDGILYSSVASAAYQFVGWPGCLQASLDLAADPGFNLVTITRDQTLVRHHRYRIIP